MLVRHARLREHAGDAAGAIALYQRALLSDPEAPGASTALIRLLTTASRAMELRSVLEAEVSRVSDPAAKVALLLEVARICERDLEDTAAAVAALERAATVAPQSGPVLDELARHHQREERWAALREVLERRAHGLAAVSDRVSAWAELAELCATRLGDDVGAERWYRAALSLDPKHAPSLRGLAGLLARQERWRDAVEILLEEADAATSADLRAAACARAGVIAEQHLGDLAFAIGQHERAVTLVPGYAPSYTALLRLYDETGRADARVALHERAAGWATTPSAAVHELFMAATLYETRLGSPRHAVGVYEQILEIAPQRLDALHALQRAADEAGMFTELLAAVDRELTLLEGGAEASVARRVSLELRAAAVCADALGAPERAIAHHRRALALDPDCVAAWDALERLYRELGRWEDLARALDALLEHEPAGPGAVARLLELAWIHESALGRPGAALAYLERALHQRPRDRRVLGALAETLERAGLHPRQAEILSLLVDVTEDPAGKAALACRLGAVASARLGDFHLAREAYERALAAQPGWRPARDALARLASAPEAPDEVRRDLHEAFVRALDAEVQRSEDPDARRQTALTAAQCLIDGLDDPKRGQGRLAVALVASPGDVAALAEQEVLAQDAGDRASTRAAGRALARAVEAPTVAAAVLVDTAWGALTDGTDDAVADLWRALELRPSDPEALLLLEHAALERGDEALSRRVDARLVAAAEGVGAAGMTDRFARLAETLEAAGDGGALLAWMDAVQADPASLTAAWGLYRVAEAAGDVETVAVALQHLAALVGDASEGADLLVRLARVRGASLQDADGELETLDAALTRDPNHAGAAARLVEVARTPEAVRFAVPALRRAARSASEPERAHALWRQVGRWHEAPLGERGAAIAAYEEALTAIVTDGPLYERLAELYLRDAQNAEAVRCLEAAVEHTDDPARCRAVTRRLAEVVANALGDQSWACELLDDVLTEDPDDLAARRLRLRLLESLGRSEDAVAELRVLIAAAEGDAERAELYLDVAALLASAGDEAGAFDALLEAVALEGPRGEAATACHAAKPDDRDAERYLAALERWSEAHPGEVDGTYHREVARVRVQVLGRSEEGVDALVAAVTAAPDDLALRETLVRTLVMSGDSDEAVETARDLVLTDPGRVTAWRALRAALLAAGRESLARRALEGLITTGEASDAEQSEFRAGADAWVSTGMTPEALRALGDERQESWATERLLAELSHHVEAIEPDALDVLHLERCEQIAPGEHALWTDAERCAKAFGVERFTLLGAPEPGGRVRVAPGARVIAPAGFHTATPGVRRFELARAFALVGRGLEPVEVLGASFLRALVAAGERLVNPRVAEPVGLRPGIVDELTRRIVRVVPRRARGAIEDCAADALREGPNDLLAWRTSWSRTAVRAALLVSGDLPSAPPRIASTWGRDGVRDALAFWVSDLADRTRRDLTGRDGGRSTGW